MKFLSTVAIIVLWISCFLFFNAGVGVLSSARGGIHEVFGAILLLAAVNCLGFGFIIAGIFRATLITGPENSQKCPDCGADIPADASVCMHCRCRISDEYKKKFSESKEKAAVECPHCGEERGSDAAVFCPYCKRFMP